METRNSLFLFLLFGFSKISNWIIKNTMLYYLWKWYYDKKNNKEIEYTYLSIASSFLCNSSDDEIFNVVIHNDYEKLILLLK